MSFSVINRYLKIVAASCCGATLRLVVAHVPDGALEEFTLFGSEEKVTINYAADGSGQPIVLGEGSYAKVYKAEIVDRQTGENIFVAVKVFTPEKLQNLVDRANVEREIEMNKMLAPHPHQVIARYFGSDFKEDGGNPKAVLVMELCTGTDLFSQFEIFSADFATVCENLILLNKI